MEQLIQRCAGIDVGQAESMVCVRVPDAVTGFPAELIASYGTTTPAVRVGAIRSVSVDVRTKCRSPGDD